MNYKNINDYEILYLVSEDMDSNYDILFQKYLPIIKSISSKYFPFASNHGAEYQDLVQEGFLALNKAITTYKDNAKTIFYTYACVCIERHLVTYCRSLSAQKHYILNMALPDELYSCTLVRDNSELSNFFEFHPMELYLFISKVMYSFDLITRCIFELKFNGFSYVEISQLLDLSISMVDSRLCRARKVMQRCYKDAIKN